MLSNIGQQVEKALGDNFGADRLEKAPPTVFRERKYTHWPQHTTGAGAVVGIVATVAGCVLASLTLISLGIALFATNFVGTCYLRKFEPLASLEGYIHLLINRVKELGKRIVDLSKVDQEKVELNRKLGKFEEIKEKLITAEKTYEQLKDEVEAVSTEMARFNEENGKFHKNIELLKEQAAGTGAGFLVKDLHYQASLQRKLYEKIKEEREQLRQQIEDLVRVQEKIALEILRVQEAEEEVSRALNKDSEAVRFFRKMEGAISNLRSLLENLALKPAE